MHLPLCNRQKCAVCTEHLRGGQMNSFRPTTHAVLLALGITIAASSATAQAPIEPPTPLEGASKADNRPFLFKLNAGVFSSDRQLRAHSLWHHRADLMPLSARTLSGSTISSLHCAGATADQYRRGSARRHLRRNLSEHRGDYTTEQMKHDAQA